MAKARSKSQPATAPPETPQPRIIRPSLSPEECESRDSQARHVIREVLDRNIMVEAAAGTGKTTSIVARLLNLISRGVAEHDKIAAITFTRKAAAELRTRFHAELLQRLESLKDTREHEAVAQRNRLELAAASPQSLLIGTIHSFCATLIRERPIEFGVEPDFRELEADENEALRKQAWEENIADLIASGDPLIGKIEELGLRRSQLQDCFERFIEYRDIEHWPSEVNAEFDLRQCQQQVREYVAHLSQFVPLFPRERGNDKLMSRIELIVRMNPRSWSSESRFFRLLEQFDHSHGCVQSQWHDKGIAKRELTRWEEFRDSCVRPAMTYWREKRYEFVVQFVRRALGIYERIKTASGALDFTDLLLITARGLKHQPHLRRYFQARYTHLLIDEFQDTDPVQAELVTLLASDDVSQTDWRSCRLRSGALFVVGDPKQSIYRFRRGDIVTYNRTAELFKHSDGQLVSLLKNFRSTPELIAWNNQLYAQRFPAAADDYAPAMAEMFAARSAAPADTLHGVFKLTLPPGKVESVTQAEADTIAAYIRRSMDSQAKIVAFDPHSQSMQPRCVRFEDFLILLRSKKSINLFREALERQALPVDASGNNAYHDLPALALLRDCLIAADDPSNPLALLSLLRNRLFGLSDAELFRWKQAGGSFHFQAPTPSDVAPELAARFRHAWQTLQRYQFWLRTLPPATAVEMIASHAGLLAESTLESAGPIALGSLLKAIECLRHESRQFDSAADMISALERIATLDEAAACSAMRREQGAIRIMNLHKAKGLEAPIVFLAETSSPNTTAPRYHIARLTEPERGYLSIAEKLQNRPDIKLAQPSGWERFQEEEQRYLTAEANRLLYVATTRAASMMVISVGKDNSGWSGLHAALEDCPELPIGSSAQSNAAHSAEQDSVDNRSRSHQLTANNTSASAATIAERWQRVQQPLYEIRTAKELGMKGSRRPNWQASGEYGVNWGTALHQLLDLCHQSPQLELSPRELEREASAIAAENDIEPVRVSELVATATAVVSSDLWKRARAAPRSFSELPFDVTLPANSSCIVRGVIDLIFEEPDGWVIVDYKSDDITLSDIASAITYYRGQLQEYAAHWQRVTGLPVKETGLFLTKIKKYVAC